MKIDETARRVRLGERRLLRLQRRLWLAQLAFWPTVVVIAVLSALAAWAVWKRRSRPHQSLVYPPTAPAPAAPAAN